MSEMLVAITFGLMSALLWGTADFLSRETSKIIGHYLTSSYNQLTSFIWLVGFAFLFGIHFPILNSRLLSLNILLGMLDFLSIVFLYKGLSEGVMSIVAPISSAYPAVTVILAVIILEQTLTLFNAYAIAGVIIGVVLSGVKMSDLRASGLKLREPDQNGRGSSHSDRSRRYVEGLNSALLSCLAGGGLFFGLGVLTPSFGPWFPSIVIKGSAAIVGFGFLFLLKKKFRIPNTKTWCLLALMGMMDCFSFLVFSFGIILAGGYLPLVVTFSGLAGLVVLFLARIFYGERLTRIQSLGIFLVIISALSILYFQRF